MSRREHYEPQCGKDIGSAEQEKDGFPNFKEGDVQIIISGSRQYRLHASLLRSFSPRLDRMLDKHKAAHLSTKAIKRGVTARFCLVAVPNSPLGGGPSHILKAVALNDDGKPASGYRTSLDLENGIIVPSIFNAYHAVLGAMYSQPLDLGDFQTDSLISILEVATGITEVAEYLECIPVITRSIEATLFATGQTFHQAIANDPIAWLGFASDVKSRAIFREALIHAAGKYSTIDVQGKLHRLDPQVGQIVVKKGSGLKEAVRQAQLKVLTYYPQHIQREKTLGLIDKDNFGRASYANDIFSWMALVVFRHFAAQCVANDLTHHAKDLGYAYVKTLMDGGDAYLQRKEMLAGFHKYFPVSGKGESVVENHLNLIKDHVKRFVSPLTKNESQLDIRRFPVNHFTCTNVDVHDYPWDNGKGNLVTENEDQEIPEGDTRKHSAQDDVNGGCPTDEYYE